jgi:hypothetical protein
MTATPLDAARDALITLQGQLIALLAAQNAALAGRVAGLETANAELAGRVARLERAAPRNSGNSSMPPSAEALARDTRLPRKPEHAMTSRDACQAGSRDQRCSEAS